MFQAALWLATTTTLCLETYGSSFTDITTSISPSLLASLPCSCYKICLVMCIKCLSVAATCSFLR